MARCLNCDGKGREENPFLERYVDCDACKGRGFLHKNTEEVTCPYCGSTEVSDKPKTLSVFHCTCSSCFQSFIAKEVVRYDTHETL